MKEWYPIKSDNQMEAGILMQFVEECTFHCILEERRVFHQKRQSNGSRNPNAICRRMGFPPQLRRKKGIPPKATIKWKWESQRNL
jgi:hypothetical protein